MTNATYSSDRAAERLRAEHAYAKLVHALGDRFVEFDRLCDTWMAMRSRPAVWTAISLTDRHPVAAALVCGQIEILKAVALGEEAEPLSPLELDDRAYERARVFAEGRR